MLPTGDTTDLRSVARARCKGHDRERWSPTEGEMTEIFLSYASADRGKAIAVERALSTAGHSVFWDQETPPGRDWDSWIREKLANAKVVVVLWSKASVASANVRHEAMIARNAGQLIPVLIERLEPSDFPMGLYLVQGVMLDRWDGDPSAPAFHKLLTEISARKNEPPPPPIKYKKRSLKPNAIAVLLMVLVASAGAYAMREHLFVGAPQAPVPMTDAELASAILVGEWRWDGIACGEGPIVTHEDDLFVFTTPGAPTYRHVLESVLHGASPTITTLVVEPEDARGDGFAFQRQADQLALTNRTDGRTDQWQKCL